MIFYNNLCLLAYINLNLKYVTVSFKAQKSTQILKLTHSDEAAGFKKEKLTNETNQFKNNLVNHEPT